MEIEYLIKMKNTPKIKYTANRGISEEKINQIESKMKVKLPKAFKEFLFLGGDYEEILSGWNRDFDDLEFIQEYAQEAVKKEKIHLRPFWCFAEYDDADSFMFFFLDDGDNPAVYNFIAEKGLVDNDGNEISYIKFRDSFSSYIDGGIDEALK